MNFTLIALLTFTTLLATPAWPATIFKCKNTQGAFLYQEKPCAEETKSVSSWGVASGAPLVMSQSSSGHYFVDGSINEHKLNFVIDTGASTVAIPQGLADQAGLVCLRQSVSKTANGLARTCMTVIQKLKFGSFILTNVEASIAPNLGQPLLGMNVLKQFRVEQDSGEMRMSIK
jgi:clan AA aspartic protease (TIGR02281 family)